MGHMERGNRSAVSCPLFSDQSLSAPPQQRFWVCLHVCAVQILLQHYDSRVLLKSSDHFVVFVVPNKNYWVKSIESQFQRTILELIYFFIKNNQLYWSYLYKIMFKFFCFVLLFYLVLSCFCFVWFCLVWFCPVLFSFVWYGFVLCFAFFFCLVCCLFIGFVLSFVFLFVHCIKPTYIYSMLTSCL